MILQKNVFNVEEAIRTQNTRTAHGKVELEEDCATAKRRDVVLAVGNSGRHILDQHGYAAVLHLSSMPSDP
jgi:hypothetical protein